MAEFVVEVVVGHSQMELQPDQQQDGHKTEDVAAEKPKEEEEPVLQETKQTEDPAPKKEDPATEESKLEERKVDEPKVVEVEVVETKLVLEEHKKDHLAIEGTAGGHASVDEQQPAEQATEQKAASGHQEAMELEQDDVEDSGEGKEHASDPGAAGILPPSGPYWLSSEEVMAKGIPESEVENYKKFFLLFSHLPQAWCDRLKDHAFETEIFSLSSEEVTVLIKASRANGAEPQLTEDDRRVISNIEDRLGVAIAKFGDSGANIRLGNHSPRDGLYLNEDPAFVASVQEAIVAELEAEPLSENAYSGWKEKAAPHKSGFKKGIDTIRKSFRRSRTPKKVLLDGSAAEAPAGQEHDLTQQQTTQEGLAAAPPSSSEAPPPTETDQNHQVQQAEVQQAEVHQAEVHPTVTAGPPAPPVQVHVAEELPLEQQTQDMTLSQTMNAVIEHMEDPSFGLSMYSASQNSPDDANKSASNENVASGGTEGVNKDVMAAERVQAEVEVKPKPAPADGEEIQRAGEETQRTGEEIQRVEGEEGEQQKLAEQAAQDAEVVTPKRKTASEEQSHHKRVKAETPPNQVLRAFMRVMSAMLRVTSGREALDRVLTSPAFKDELTCCQQLHQEALIYVMRYDAHTARYPDFRFRGFVHKNELCALTQLTTTAYSPTVALYKENVREMVSEFFSAHVKEPLSNYESYAVDFVVQPNKVLVGKLYPFHSGIEAFMFSWRKDLAVLTGNRGPVVFRILKSSKSNPFAGLMPHWQNTLQSIHQQRGTDKKSGKCVLL